MARQQLIESAESWVAGLWAAAVERWSGRVGQDKSYREHVIHPALGAILGERFGTWACRILEIGCGDGIFLEHGVGEAISSQGGTYLGMDISTQLIEQARQRHPEPSLSFLQADIAATGGVQSLGNTGRWDCALSVFAIQEIPDATVMLTNMRALLPAGATTLFVTVHPGFGQWLKDTGGMPVNAALNGGNHGGTGGPSGPLDFTNTNDVPWRWAGAYPIVDEPYDPFYLPYFHRTIDDYRAMLAHTGFAVEDIRELPEAEHQLPSLVERHISPFYPFNTNVYWPRMGEAPSAIVIIATTEDR